MDGVNKTLYIPLYGKQAVSRKGLILSDKKAEEIWTKAGFALRGKAKSKWLAYYMAIRAKVFDDWVNARMAENPGAVVLHVGCGLDSRVLRVGTQGHAWFDLDFPEVIAERRKYYEETAQYHMAAADMRTDAWKALVPAGGSAVIVMEGITMYMQEDELAGLLAAFRAQFDAVFILMDCYTQRGAGATRWKNPINEVGVTRTFGYDHPEKLAEKAGIRFAGERDMVPEHRIRELKGAERCIFKALFAGGFARSMYRMYEFVQP